MAIGPFVALALSVIVADPVLPTALRYGLLPPGKSYPRLHGPHNLSANRGKSEASKHHMCCRDVSLNDACARILSVTAPI